MGDYLSYGLNTLGPLCLWQCFGVKSRLKILVRVKDLTFCNSDYGLKQNTPAIPLSLKMNMVCIYLLILAPSLGSGTTDDER